MRKIIALAPGFLLFLFSTLASAQQSPQDLWKMRAAQAQKKLESLPKENPSPQTQVERMVETAFALYATDPELVHKEESGLDLFKILIEKDGRSPFILNYVYESASGELKLLKVEKLPSGWYLHVLPERPQAIILDIDNTVKGYGVVFDLTDPFNPVIENFNEG